MATLQAQLTEGILMLLSIISHGFADDTKTTASLLPVSTYWGRAKNVMDISTFNRHDNPRL